MGNIVRFGVSIDESLLQHFDDRNKDKGYTNRSEAVRDLVRESLVSGEWSRLSGEKVGVVSIVYDHDRLELPKNLIRDQHSHHSVIISSTHVHLDRHNCLEVIIMRGDAKQIRELSERMISRRGVKHGKLFMTTTGKDLL